MMTDIKSNMVKTLTVLMLILSTGSGLLAAPLVFSVTSYEETWLGSWLWLPREGQQIPAGHIDPALWIAKYPGAWEATMVNYALGGSAAAGVKDIYWDIYNRYGMVLFPSTRLPSRVLKNPNSGYDFSAFDAAAVACQVARMDGVDLGLTVWWDSAELAGQAVLDGLSRYRNAKIVVLVATGDQRDNAERFIAQHIAGLDADRIALAGTDAIDARVDLTVMGRFPTESQHYHNTMHEQHTHPGPVLFLRKIDWYDIDPNFENEYRRCLVSVGAFNTWTVFVNGQKIHSAQRQFARFQTMQIFSRTYDVTRLMEPGENWVAILAEPSGRHRGMIANIKAGEMVYKSDAHWLARTVDGTPDAARVADYVADADGWSRAALMGRPHILMNSGKRYWHRQTPWWQPSQVDQ